MIVGALVSCVKFIIKNCLDFCVMKLDKGALKGDELKYFIPQECAADAIGAADKLVITGVTLLNDMLEDISAGKNSGAEAYCRRAGRVDALKVLCDIDVSHVGGVHTAHADEVLDVIAQAGYGYYVSRKFAEKLVIRCLLWIFFKI